MDPWKVDLIMDPKLEDLYSSQGAKIAAMLAYQYLSHQPKVRPTMSAVVKTLAPLMEMKDIPRHFVCEVTKPEYKGDCVNQIREKKHTKI